MGKYAIGLDYGTLSVRALLLNLETGEETGTAVFTYPHGVMEHHPATGERLPAGWALQNPADYLEGMEKTIRSVLDMSGCCPEEVVGIGVDVTSSTVLPVKADKTPLCMLEEFAAEPHAYVKLWKHHGAEKQARMIEEIAEKREESWLSLYGGKVSSEWMLPKILETLEKAPLIYQAADRYLEVLDWLIWMLTGQESRSACGAGYKAFYHHEKGYPSRAFLKEIHPGLENLVEEKLAAPIRVIGEKAGYLTEDMAHRLGLLPRTPVGTAIIDAHAAVLGSGVSKPGTMMIIVGTSSCHMLLSETEKGIPGVAGIVKDGIVPGFFGYEAGQCCVGDHFDWFVKNCVPAAYEAEAKAQGISMHQLLVQKLQGGNAIQSGDAIQSGEQTVSEQTVGRIRKVRAGQSGLLALDWFNGVRSPLMDFDLNGMILGLNLNTRPEEIYLALIEATAYGTRMIIESFEEAGVPVESIVLGGGIPAKNEMLVQIYADVCKKEIRLAASANASARGAAILGAAAAQGAVGFPIVAETAAKLGTILDVVYKPDSDNATIYDKLYAEYVALYEYFGKGVNDVMKRLNKVRK